MYRVRSSRPLVSLSEYLLLEEQSDIKHEFIAGEVYAMSGVTTRHNIITLNLARKLHGIARAHGCKVFATDVKLRAASDRIYYPDMMVAFGRAAEVELIVEEPSLIVETTSPSTRATDRREKLEAYLRIPSLRMYLIVEQRHRHAIAYIRRENGEWLREEVQGEGEIAIPFLESRVTMDEIYEDVTLPPLTVKEDDGWDDGWDDEWDDDEAIDS